MYNTNQTDFKPAIPEHVWWRKCKKAFGCAIYITIGSTV